MSQDWTPLEYTHTLTNSMGFINGNFNSCKSNFAGTSAPALFVEGQCYYNMSDKYVYWRGAGGWHKIFQATGAGGTLLPRSGTSEFPMTGELFMNMHRIRSIANPTDNQDAATRGWTLDAIDSHYHTGGGAGTGPRIQWDQLASTGHTTQTVLQVNAAGTFLENRHQNGNHTTSPLALGSSESDVIAVSVWAWASERKYIIYGFRLYGTGGTTTVVLYKDSTPILQYNVSPTMDHTYMFPYTNTSTEKTFVWKVTLNPYSTGNTVSNRFILVL